MKRIFSLLILIGCTHFSFAQFQQIQELKEADKTAFSAYFYPSTLRMINMEQDTAFNKLVKGIRKLSFHQLNPDSIDERAFQLLKEDMLAAEKYEEYITVYGGGMGGQAFDIMGNEQGDEWIAMGFIEGQGYLIALRGTINWLQAPEVYQTVLEKGENVDSGFGTLLNYFKQEEQRRASRKEWKRKRQEERERAAAARDSTANGAIGNQVEN